MGEEALLNSLLSTISRSTTGIAFLFGISIPTAAFPGMGASILTRGAARARAISLESPMILLTLTPGAGSSSNLVTTGPTL